jgi:hypothetical protein
VLKIYNMNKSKELVKLFKAYMSRKEEERKNASSTTVHSYSTGRKFFLGTIYFYEWSDITREPIRYFSFPLFERFLNECDIKLQPWQKDIIYNLNSVYITCKGMSKELLIRSTYDALKLAVHGSSSNTQLTLPTAMANSPSNLRLPPVYNCT